MAHPSEQRAARSLRGLARAGALALGGSLLLAACCQDAECPQNGVVVRVVAGESAPAGVEVEGASTEWTCTELDAETVCQPETIADGTYVVTVSVPGEAPAEVELTARTFPIPPTSCDCRMPRGEATLELEGEPEPEPDAGTDPPDAG